MRSRILRFSIALNLNFRFHLLFLGAVYSAGAMGYQRPILPGQNISPTVRYCVVAAVQAEIATVRFKATVDCRNPQQKLASSSPPQYDLFSSDAQASHSKPLRKHIAVTLTETAAWRLASTAYSNGGWKSGQVRTRVW